METECHGDRRWRDEVGEGDQWIFKATRDTRPNMVGVSVVSGSVSVVSGIVSVQCQHSVSVVSGSVSVVSGSVSVVSV